MAIRVGIIGTGGIARVHGRSYSALGDRVEIVACCDLMEEKAKKYAEEFGCRKYYTDYNKMLEENKLDAVSVCTWNSTHAECSIAALNAGCNVLCEKPMAMNVDEALDMKEAAERNHKILMIGFVRRHGEDAKAAIEFIKSGQMGDIYYVKATKLRRHGFPGGWFGDKTFSGGGSLIDLGVHLIDLTKYLMGNPKPVSVYGAVFDKLGPRTEIQRQGEWTSETKVEKPVFNVEDLAVALIRFENGSILHLETSFELNTSERTNSFAFYGNKAGLSIEPFELHTVMNNRLADVSFSESPVFNFGNAFKEEIKNFVDSIEGLSEPLVTPQDGVEIMKVIDALYLSAQIGRSVELQ